MSSVNRRRFLSAAVAANASGAFRGQAQSLPAKSRFHLGSVTYNLLKDYDVETIIKTLEAVGFEAVELRTRHKHGVELSICAAERTRIRRRFESSRGPASFLRHQVPVSISRFRGAATAGRDWQTICGSRPGYRRAGNQTPAHGIAGGCAAGNCGRIFWRLHARTG